MNGVEAIRSEIERRRKEFIDKGEQTFHDAEIIRRAVISDCNDILSFIDSLPQLSEDLEEAAEEYENGHTFQRYDGGGLTPEYNATLAESFIAGAKWREEQGVKATGTISPRGIIYDNNIGYRLFLERYHYGDKVEVQIRKIEENGK